MKAILFLPLLLLGASGHTSVVMAQSSSTFTATGKMTTARAEHTATLLLDGRVLIAGGFVDGLNFSPTNSAELYDPSTGIFGATGSMTSARYLSTATLLPNGRVLIAGGGDASGRLGLSAELYDPSTGTFSATGSMAAGHLCATLLKNGKVLMGLPPDASAEVYDPATGTFTATTGGYADTTSLWPWETATLLADGKVLIAGDSSAELYDPLTGGFNLTGTMIYGYAAIGRSATLLTSGKVLFAGGELDRDSTSGDLWSSWYPYAELYDSSAGNFAATGNMTAARWAHTATLLPDGRVLITGGELEMEQPHATYQSAELYDPSTGTFGSIGNMTARRSRHTATLLNDGKVLITGGTSEPTTAGPLTSLASAELYIPPVLVPAPVLLSLSGDGKGQGAIQHANTVRIASAADPAVAGEYLSIYLTGLADGSVIPPQVAIGGRLAEITFFGNVPGYPGLDVINVRMPSGVTPGPADPVRLNYLSRPSNEVTIGVQ